MSVATPQNHFDIIVVGAGLVGATFTSLLMQQLPANKTLRIALVDTAQAPQIPDIHQQPPEFDPRVVALTHASQSILTRLGVWETITATRACAYTHMHVWDNEGTANLHFSATDIHQATLGHIVENTIVLSAVLETLGGYDGVVLMRGVGIESIQPQDDITQLQMTNGELLTANLIVAADGGQSKIRELSGIAVREWEYGHQAIVATVECEREHQMTAWQNFLSTGPLAFLPLGDPSKRYCSIVWSVENERAEQLMAQEDNEFCADLGKAFEHRLGRVLSVSRRYRFPLIQRHAVEYAQDNMVLVGDAAHTIHPLAGQGVNLGLLDAQALVAEICRGLSRDLAINESSIVRRYQRQRKGHNMEVMLLMEGLKRLFGSRQLWVRWLRNMGMKKVNEWQLLKNWLAKQAVRDD